MPPAKRKSGGGDAAATAKAKSSKIGAAATCPLVEEVRPYQLGFRSDFAFSSVAEPEDLEMLMQLILVEGFRTDADVLPGVERVSIMKPDVNILNSNYVELKKLPEADSVRPRRAPNAFHLMRQADILQRCGQGNSEQQLKDAFTIGRAEARAMSNLYTRVDKELMVMLREAVAKRGLQHFMTHDLIGLGAFNQGWTSAQGPMESWVPAMTNGDDKVLVKFFLERICHDWDNSAERMRKALGYKEGVKLHACCGLFLHFLELLHQKAPAGEFPDFEKQLRATFMSGLMDAELTHIAETAVPPGDITAIGAFRDKVKSYETRIAIETEERAKELAEKLANATFEQLSNQIETDIALIRSRGEDFTKTWMEANCRLAVVGPHDKVSATLPDFNRFMSDKQVEGTVWIVAAIDATVWSVNDAMADMIQMMTSVCSTGSTCIGYIQMPVFQAQTSMAALGKRKRLIEDALLKADMDFSSHMTIMFTKESTRASTDKRPASQPVLLCAYGKNNRWLESSPVLQGAIFGPCSRCNVADMRGYDADSKPGAAARAEQKGVQCHKEILSDFFKGMPFERSDLVVWLDIGPNRYAEFASACVDHSLKGEEPQLAYVGFLREHQKDVIASIESTVFTHWDSLPSSPPKTRARAESRINVSGLQLLSCDSAGRPGFPDHVMGKFAPGSAQHKKLCEIKEAFQREFPASAGRDGGAVTTPGTVPRASGECDFSIDDGKEPLSVERVVELSFGFNTGNFEMKIAANKRDSAGIPWRLASDLDFIVVQKRIIPVCKYFHQLATSQGLGEVSIFSHEDSDDGEQVPVPFRYSVTAVKGNRTNVFRPNSLQGDAKQATAGETFAKVSEPFPYKKQNTWALKVIAREHFLKGQTKEEVKEIAAALMAALPKLESKETPPVESEGKGPQNGRNLIFDFVCARYDALKFVNASQGKPEPAKPEAEPEASPIPNDAAVDGGEASAASLVHASDEIAEPDQENVEEEAPEHDPEIKEVD
ncbi:unnamed protein product [Durusdinium trenchii]|uniref:Uncharacterized protein n=1 Tax=Durusdinium trenchii TaxID=1381693 RepID=A0ABP0M2Q2_9DINO